MDLQTIRLECIKVANQPQFTLEEVVGRAKTFEAYIVGKNVSDKAKPKKKETVE